MNVTFMSLFDDERHNHHFPPRAGGVWVADDHGRVLTLALVWV